MIKNLKIHVSIAIALTIFCSFTENGTAQTQQIAFIKRANSSSASGAIWSVRSDGKGQRRLTAYGNYDHPAWTPDGRRIVYTFSQSESDNSQLWSMNADGTDQRQITRFPSGSCSQPVVFSGSKSVLFHYETSEGVPEPDVRSSLCRINLNGSGFKVLTSEEGNSATLDQPSLAFGGSVLSASEGHDAGTGSLHLLNPATRRKRLIYGFGKQHDFYSIDGFALSPAKSRIAFRSSGWVSKKSIQGPDSKRSGIVVMGANGTGAKLVLTASFNSLHDVDWLTNNKLIYADEFALRTFDLKSRRRAVVLVGKDIYSPAARPVTLK